MMYTKEQKAEWQRARLAQEIKTGRIKPTPEIRAFIKGTPSPVKKAMPLRETVIRPQPRRANARSIVADASVSTCFSDLRWSHGVATGTFQNPTVGTWEWDCSREEFMDWIHSGSLGEYFNDNIRNPDEKED